MSTTDDSNDGTHLDFTDTDHNRGGNAIAPKYPGDDLDVKEVAGTNGVLTFEGDSDGERIYAHEDSVVAVGQCKRE